MGTVRIAIVSHDRLFSEGLCHILQCDSSFVVLVLDELSDETQSEFDIRIVDAAGGATLPDVPESGGPHVIAVNAPDDDGWAANALSVGVRGILSHRSRTDELLRAVRVVYEGGIWAPAVWLDAYAHRLSEASRPETASGSGETLVDHLSNREREVFRHAATGIGNKELAHRLAISEATVKVHLTRIFRKLGVNGRAELAAAYHGLRPRAGSSVQRRSA